MEYVDLEDGRPGEGDMIQVIAGKEAFAVIQKYCGGFTVSRLSSVAACEEHPRNGG